MGRRWLSPDCEMTLADPRTILREAIYLFYLFFVVFDYY